MKTNKNIEISIVIPCLNESETLQICIDKIKKKILEKNFNGEIIVSDNGSTDGSLDIAKKNDVRIINVEKKVTEMLLLLVFKIHMVSISLLLTLIIAMILMN